MTRLHGQAHLTPDAAAQSQPSGFDASARAVPALEAREITKIFDGTLALDKVSLAIRPGEVHGLVGKNGAGKSTLMKILSGAIRPDSGSIRVLGNNVGALDPIHARKTGIGVVHQNAELHLNLSVASNLFLAQEKRGKFGLVDTCAMNAAAQQVLGDLGLSLAPECILEQLDIADRQLVAIAKAMQGNASILLLDEPTAALNKSQTDFLFRLIRSLSTAGVATVYISHHLDEVIEVTDRISVLRNGQLRNVVDSATTDKNDLVDLMVGQRFDALAPPACRPHQFDPALELSEISVPGRLGPVSLTIGKGEIVGLISRTGGGASELSAVIGGIQKPQGSYSIYGKPFCPQSIRQAVAAGVVFVPEDMRGKGLVMPMSSAGNMTLARLGALAKQVFIDPLDELAVTEEIGTKLDLVPRDTSKKAATLSGGNQRKLLIGRAMIVQAHILALEEPTQGVDIESRRQIHDQIRELAAQGATVTFSSTDPEELLELSDRVVLLADGKIVAELHPQHLNIESLLLAVQTDGVSLKEKRRD